MFPVTVGGVTYNLSDFYPLTYVTGLPNSISSMKDELFAACTGTSVTSLTIGAGSKTLTTQANLRIGEYINVARNTEGENFRMVGIVTAYNSTTGSLTFTTSSFIGAGTFSDWIISPALFGGVRPLGISYGGTGGDDNKTLRAEAGEAYPGFSMQRIFDDFEANPIHLEYSSPWYITKPAGGTGVTAVTTAGLVGADTSATTYYGALILDAYGTDGESRADYARCFVGYGKTGFMNVIKGGPIEWRSAVRVSALPDSSEIYATRLGLRGNGSTLDVNGNFLDQYGLGFEFGGAIEDGKICGVVCIKGVRTRINTGVAVSTTAFVQLKIVTDPFYDMAYWYVNDSLVMEFSLAGWENSVNSLVHPAFSHESESLTTKKAYFDFLYCTQRINRGVV